jgi:hypothetical protein
LNRRPLTALRTILQAASRALGVQRVAHEVAIQEMWAEVAGVAAAAHSRPAGLRASTLLVDAEAGLWIQELSAQRGGIAAEINRRLGVVVVTEIRIRPGRVNRPEAEAPPAAAPAELSGEDLAHVERTVAEIADPDLRDATRRAMVSQLRWQRARRHER